MSEQGKRVRANIRAAVNAAKVRREKRAGRDVIVVPSATLPDNIVMNGIRYPANEIEASYKGLEGTPAPLGHPTIDGAFVSAKTPIGLNMGYFGAWNENVRREGGRVMLDKVIDVERASESAMGKRVLAALEKRQPIHTSTGLLVNLRPLENDDAAEYEATDMDFDHDAILLDEPGAATPEQGVGMLVNAALTPEGDRLDAINSELDERMDDHIDALGTELLSSIERKATASRWEQIKAALLEMLGTASQPEQPTEADDMGEDTQAPAANADYEAVVARLDKIEERMNAMEEAVANMGEKAAEADEVMNSLRAEKQAARNALEAQVVEAGILDADAAKVTPDAALNALLNSRKAKPSAPGIFGAFNGGGDAAPDFSPLAKEA
jgi:hypothetical protein